MTPSKDFEMNYDELVRAFLDTYSINDDGNLQFGFREHGKFLRYQNILANLLMKNEEFEQKFDAARYSFPFPKNPMSDSTLDSIVIQLKKDNVASFENCKFLFEKKVMEVQSIPFQIYDLYFFLDIEAGSDFEPCSVAFCGISFDFLITNPSHIPFSSPHISERLRILNSRMNKRYPKYNTICIHFPISARNECFAMKEGIRYAQFILGWIGLINNFHASPTFFFQFPHPYEKCPSPVMLLVGNQKNECVSDMIWKFEEIKRNCPVPIEDIRSIISSISNGTTDAQEVLLSAMNAYYTGLHEDNMGYSLLAFWATIERLCLQDEKLSHKKMLNRLFFLVLPLSKIEINMLLELRNKAIHQWDYDAICEYERHLVKNYADLLLDYFMNHFLSFNREEIKLFYSNTNCHSKQLETLEKTNYKVFKLIKEMRVT